MNDNPKTEPPNELKEPLIVRIAKAGEDDFMVKQLRRQIAAQESGLNSRQLFSGHPCILRFWCLPFFLPTHFRKIFARHLGYFLLS